MPVSKAQEERSRKNKTRRDKTFIIILLQVQFLGTQLAISYTLIAINHMLHVNSNNNDNNISSFVRLN